MPGKIFYSTGRPCKRGHVGLRYTKTRTCVACAKVLMTHWRQNNHVVYLERQRERQRGTNPERRVRNRQRRARVDGAEGSYTQEYIEHLMVHQHGICAAPFCAESIEDSYHVDHIVAVNKGGTNWPNNLQLLCPSCNCSKGAKEYGTWVQEKQCA